MSEIEDRWLANIKRTMAIDVSRFISAQWPPKAIVDGLFQIPEVDQAFHLRANRRRPLVLDPSTDAEKQEIADALNRVADWLEPGNEREAATLRSIAAQIMDGGASEE